MKLLTTLFSFTTITAIGAVGLYINTGQESKVSKQVSTSSIVIAPDTLPKPTQSSKTVIDTLTPKPYQTLPLQSDNNYENAVNEIIEMLEGKRPLSFKRAVFLSENAYLGGSLNYTEFCKQFDEIKIKCQKMIEQKGIQQHRTAGNWAIFTYMSDSIPENNYSPLRYNFDALVDENNCEGGMVSYLLKANKGNCHSMPYFYKIMANELKVEAFIATAPMHLYIRHKDEQEKWWNLELTGGSFSRTSFIMETFNITDAGIESGLYMKALSEKESVALALSDLLTYYDKQTGIYYGNLVRKACMAGLKAYPNSLLLLTKADELKYRLDNKMEAKGLSDYKKIKPYPEIIKLYKEYDELRKYIKKIGYVSMSSEEYKVKVDGIFKENNIRAEK